METITVLSAKEFEGLIKRYEDATDRLIQTERELAARKGEQYVTWEWVCEFFGVTKMTAVAMLRDEKVFVYGRKVKRLKKSDVLRFAERNSLKVREVSQ